MKKIGLIDYYLDNWHASNLPAWLERETGGEYKIAYAYGALDPATETCPRADARTSADWCRAYGVEQLASPAEVIAKSDVLLVLAPNNPEQHEALSREALASGKRTYIDKTFAPDVATAKRIFDMAEKGNTPMFSSSALRFSNELRDVKTDGIRTVSTRGAGVFAIYSIHQIEMIVKLLGSNATRVMGIGTPDAPALVIEFEGGRYATMGHFGQSCPFNLALRYDDGEGVVVPECTNFFENFTTDLVHFFKTGEHNVPKEQTIAVIGIREKGLEALAKPGVWIDCDY